LEALGLSITVLIVALVLGYYANCLNFWASNQIRLSNIKKEVNSLYIDQAIKFEPKFLNELAASINSNSIKYKIPRHMIEAIIFCESDYNQNSTSYYYIKRIVIVKHKKNIIYDKIPLAKGLMQVNFAQWKNVFPDESKYYDIVYNINAGTYIFNYLLKKDKGDIIKAICDYNGSSKFNCYANKVMKTYYYLNNLEENE
jgi:soluble lytic murein transglycosylase-like protein